MVCLLRKRFFVAHWVRPLKKSKHAGDKNRNLRAPCKIGMRSRAVFFGLSFQRRNFLTANDERMKSACFGKSCFGKSGKIFKGFLAIFFAAAFFAAGACFADGAFAADKRAEAAWKALWGHFYSPKTSMFYDYLNSWEKGEQFKYFPKPEEISRNIPNPMGYGTGMENAAINADIMMIATLAKYDATHEPSLADAASKIFGGIWNCVMEHANPGFVLRGKSPFDAAGRYPVSSRDQVTEAVNAAFLYWRSPLSAASDKSRAARLLCAIADHQMRTVKPENGYNFLDADGKRPQRGAALSKMWEVAPHEAARLPMIYIAAYEVSKDEKYLREYEKYADAAVEQSFGFSDNVAPWAHWQMHLSLRLISELAPDARTRTRCAEILEKSKVLGVKRLLPALKRWESLPDSTKYMLAPDWRETGGEEGAAERKKWRSVWFASEAPAYAGMVIAYGGKMSDQERRLVRSLLEAVEFDRIAGQAMIYYLALYWLAA